MNLRAALFYASKGWPVLPVWPVRDGKCACNTDCGKNAGKHPISWYRNVRVASSGLDDATTDPDKIRGWWKLIPDANIGCVGKKWFALDVDNEDVLEMLEDEHGSLPHTLMQYSGSGGRHILFKQPVNPIGSRRGKIPKGIDVRGDNGYILLAPSNHLEGNYMWELSSKPSMAELADAPGWLLDMIGTSAGAVAFVGDAGAPDLDKLDISDVTRDRIMTADHSDRSTVDQQVVNALVAAGLTDVQIRAVYQTYPIGTQGKYAEKAQHGDSYLATTISKARAYVTSKAVSVAIPGKIITPEEAAIERKVITEIYWRGWHDALLDHPEIAASLFPNYLGISDERMAPTIIREFDIGFRKDYHFADRDDADYAALSVPMVDIWGNISNIDYTIVNPPEDRGERQWEEYLAPVFTPDLDFVGRKILVVMDDWDTAVYVYLKMGHGLGDDIVLSSMSKEVKVSGMGPQELYPLLDLASRSESVIFVRHLSDRPDVKWMADWIGWDKVKWVGWPIQPREMFKNPLMNVERFSRALRGAIPVI